MRNWTNMSAAQFGYTDGTQLDMFAGIEGDGCGTLDLLEAAEAAEAASVAEIAETERTDGTLFGIEPCSSDDALFAFAPRMVA